MSKSYGADVKGLAEITRNLGLFGAGAKRAMAKALYVEAERIMAESAPLVPVDFGVLKASGHVQPPEMSGERVSVTMGYGGPAEAYALVQHEDLTFRHTVGQAKYLEQPFLKAIPGLPDRLAKTISAEAMK